MPITFKCQCGKVLRAREELAGKRVKCPGCHQPVTIPAAAPPQGTTPAQAAAPAKATCPNCGAELIPNAAICVNCGQSVKAGAAAPAAEHAPQARRGPRIAMPPTKYIVGAVVLVLLIVGWFTVGAPLLAKMKMNSAYDYVRRGEIDKALAEFDKLKDKVKGENREFLELWTKQMKLELQKNTGETLHKGGLVVCDNVKMSVSKKSAFSGGAMLVKATIENTGQKPLTLRNEFFYVRGIAQIKDVAAHQKNSFGDVTLQPGEAKQGFVAFRGMPGSPVEKSVGTSTVKYYYLSYNDGENYVKCMMLY